MRRRLAKKIMDHHNRYSRGRWEKAMVRLGWKLLTFKTENIVIPVINCAFKIEKAT